MNNKFKFILSALFVLSSVSYSFAQFATATATATIITPISINKTTDMNFGNIAVTATAGTVVLVPAGTRSGTGGVTVTAALAGTISAATFKVDGEGVSTYSIAISPSSINLSSTGNTGAVDMTATNFVCDKGTIGTLTGGTQNLAIGATLNVGGSQKQGVYVSATPFTVTVNYN